MKVFLGGTCSGRKWRDDLIPMLKCDYYNPIVKDWSEADRLREVYERETADYVLYVITSGLKGVYSIAEIIDDSNKRPKKTIVCVLYDGFDKQMAHSLRAVVNLARDNGATICESLSEVAEMVNSKTIGVDSEYGTFRRYLDEIVTKYGVTKLHAACWLSNHYNGNYCHGCKHLKICDSIDVDWEVSNNESLESV